jgi:hypothetical protein
LADSVLITFARNVVTLMGGLLVLYPTPTPTLAVITTAIDAFETGVTNAFAGGVILTGIKDALRFELLVLLRQLAAYVQGHCAESVQNIIAIGFEANRAGAPVGELPAPATPVVSQGMVTGSMKASSSPVNGASIYNWRLALASAPTVFLQTAQIPGSRITFEGLTPGQIYNVQLNAVGAAGTSDWSDDGSMMII